MRACNQWPAGLTLLVGLAWGACDNGGSGNDESDAPLRVYSGEELVEARLGEAGGSLELAERARVTLPRGALDQEVELRTRVGSRLAGPGDEYEAINEPVVVEPHGLRLARPATVELTIDQDMNPGDELRVLRLDNEDDDQWERLPGVELRERSQGPSEGDLRRSYDESEQDTVSSRRRAVFEVDGFSVFLLVRSVAAPQEGACQGSSQGEVCRPAQGVCDVAEVCDGTSPTCPIDTFDEGAACDDLLFCTATDTCDATGACVGTGDPCFESGTDTDNCSESCDEAARMCTAPDPDGSACAPSACSLGECVAGVCEETVPCCPPSTTVVTFGSAPIEAHVRALIARPTGDILEEDLCQIDTLRLTDDPDIDSLEGLQFLTGLVRVNLARNAITDLSPLSGLTGLEELVLAGNTINDLSPVAALTALTIFNINFNLGSVSDITPLQNLTNLQSLELDGNNISDIAPLQNLTALQGLRLTNNPNLVDIDSVSGLTQLTYLDLAGTNLENASLSALTNLTQLDDLSLAATSINDVSVLDNLPALTRLGISNTALDNADLVHVAGLMNLLSLSLEGSAVTDLSAITGLTQLEILFTHQNALTDHSALASFVNLRTLFVGDTGMIDADLMYLQNLTSLNNLDMPNNSVTDLSALPPLPALSKLRVSGNPLDTDSCCMSIPTLESSGVDVDVGSSCAVTC